MGGGPHFRETRFQDARLIRVVLRQDAARVIEMEAPHVMRLVRHGKGLRQVLQMPGGLVNMHVVAELAQQQHQARAVQHDRMRVMRQQMQAVGRTGEQEVAQGIVAGLGVEADVLKVFFKNIQGPVRQAAQRIQRRDVIRHSFQFCMLQIITHWIAFHLLSMAQYSRLRSSGKVAQACTKIFLQKAK